MIYLTLVIALALGYFIGLMQSGIKITMEPKKEEPVEYNKSMGIEEFKEYYEKTGGVNKF